MNRAPHSVPILPLSIRISSYALFMWHEIKRLWRGHVLMLVLVIIAGVLMYRMYEVHLILLMHPKSIENIETLQDDIQALQKELEDLSAHTSRVSVDFIRSHTVNGYAGISKLLEQSVEQAKNNSLSLNYTLSPPSSIGIPSLPKLYQIDVETMMAPLPTSSTSQVWLGLQHQIRWMVKENQIYQLLGIKVLGVDEKVQILILKLRIFARLNSFRMERHDESVAP